MDICMTFTRSRGGGETIVKLCFVIATGIIRLSEVHIFMLYIPIMRMLKYNKAISLMLCTAEKI